MEETKAEILVFGSSRASHHYVPEIFEDTLKMTFYNTGKDGSGILYNYAVFKSLMKRYTPKLIIIDLRPDELYYRKINYDRLSSLLPYYHDHPEIRKIVELRSPFEKFKMISSIYPYNSILITIGMGNQKHKRSSIDERNGYSPLFNQLKNTKIPVFKSVFATKDRAVVNALDSISVTCLENDIRLVFVISPQYAKIDTGINFCFFTSLAKKYHATFVNFSNNEFFITNPSIFQDYTHLNDRGAKIFSSILAGSLKKSGISPKNF